GLSGALSSSQRIDLPGALQDKMETAFGADFSALKLYRSPEVSEAGDLAVAQGGRIAFAPDAPSLTSRAGQELLGHELSHVVAQAKGEAYGSGLLENASREAKADREGSMAASGMQISAEAETVSIGGAETGAAPMQAKRRKGKKARRRSAPVRSRRVKAPKVTQSAPSSTASEGESHSPAIIDAISGAAEG
ncbi:MAG: DUF4157 domain-containing protein, partial [Oscillospiraceae bacterium]|nr:DUF4157 domain-containing protein [Oscillospiraceae bacterium]